MRKYLILIVAAATLMGAQAATPQEEAGVGLSPYAGQEERAIKALSADDRIALLEGQGWGLAKAAELNGVPGPRHVLDLADELELNTDQLRQVTIIFSEMQKAAIRQGEAYLALEVKLDEGFRSGSLSQTELVLILKAIGEARARLRHVHLGSHLRTAEILSEHQIARYAVLRGYASVEGHGEHH